MGAKMLEQYIPIAIAYLIDNQIPVVTAFCLVAVTAILLQKRRTEIKKKDQISRREARHEKRLENANNSIRIKVRDAEKRKEKNENIPRLPAIIVEDLEAVALHRTLSELKREGKSNYDPSKTVRIYYSDKFDPKNLEEGKS